jgi:hypothetical protein
VLNAELTAEESDRLSIPTSLVKWAVFKSKPGAAPGHDGRRLEFYADIK